MRWPTRIQPKEKDVRTLIRFAWMPVLIGDVVVWMERYEILQSYQMTKHKVYFEGSNFPPYECMLLKWVSVSKRLNDAA